jgi:nucleoid-associated protein YgaU
MPQANATLTIHWVSQPDQPVKLVYNPTELNFEKSVQLAEIAIPGLNAPLQQFVRGQAEKLTVELFFDTTDSGMGAGAVSVTKQTDLIYSLTRIEPSGHAPPTVSFAWGQAVPGSSLPPGSGSQRANEFRGVVESVRQKFTLFSPDGVPLRATLNVTIREFAPLDQQLGRTNPSSPDRTHTHVLADSETLSHVAQTYYLRPTLWRPIADTNNLQDPRRLHPGVLLTVPAVLDDRRAP